MKRSRSDDIEELEQQAKRCRLSVTSPNQVATAARRLMESQTRELFREHRTQTEKKIRNAFARSDNRVFGRRAHEQGRSSSSAEIGDVDRDGGPSRSTVMADPVVARVTRVDVAKANDLRCHGVKVIPSAADSALRYYAAPREVSNRDSYWALHAAQLRDVSRFFEALFSGLDEQGRPCNTCVTAFAHAEAMYPRLKKIVNDYDQSLVESAMTRAYLGPRFIDGLGVIDIEGMSVRTSRDDSGTAEAASASAMRSAVGPLPPPARDD